ncbi:MAG: isoprenyl transferase [Oscillospiraceae bacterium]|nr:isoprenyl transferase [Oscillospiraceae bacterium]
MEEKSLPKHIGIIMDGNGRWAKKRGLPRTAGHKAGAKAFREIIKHCHERKIRYLTVYAFSTENWKRPKEEVDAIMKLLGEYLDEAFQHEEENKEVCVKIIGNVKPLALELQEKIRRLEEQTAENRGITVNIALNYGGRDELVHGVKTLVQQIKDGELSVEDLDEERISRSLYTAGQPDPDLIIRPSGELRLSNFLIWQAAYSEFVFMDVLWPDFGAKELDQALEQYAGRSRRFGDVTAK